ncbi:F-box domain protein [Aspergillus nomiae NRRL 13137]|uniref:F-box domain protein n=2 Tax=Aspergillus subgen. Circumdati TaxID=2720871 RepID=A0A0L1JAQ7_ASPN3|nr:F-box domain protein [Aspergillus nomiae NRRL 13137]KNG88802.1 F-box domain protein [Aspergillus nomiae NRRL 13137]
MHPSRHIHLPTEVVVQIVSYVDGNELDRQRTLHACCLVSRQWYSAAIAYLYERPRVDSGVSFRRFTETISPPINARKNKLNLGSFVHRLNLSHLVHHSSNSLTARLLGRVKENLEVFVAPTLTFSISSLPALSKCTNLRNLDLALVHEAISFTNLKQAISRLHKLVTLRLPQSTILTDPESAKVPWPPSLHRLQISGRFNPLLIPTFSWPPALTSLALKNCSDLSVSNLSSLMSSPQLGESLQRLTISGSNRGLTPESINAIPAFLPKLNFLSVPGDMVEDSFFIILCHVFPPLELEALEFGFPCEEFKLSFETKTLICALDSGLASLRSVGFVEDLVPDERQEEDIEIDNALQERVKRRDSQSGTEIRDDEEQVGVYYI